LSNHSSGKMGYALAEALHHTGAHVSLISGPTALKVPEGIQITLVTTAQEMLEAVLMELKHCDIFIGAAAVADYQMAHPHTQKIKKNDETLTLQLTRTPDILKTVAFSSDRPQLVIGFAAETENLLTHAQKKLVEKNCDLIIANLVGKNLGFQTEDNELWIITKKHTEKLSRDNKSALAKQLIPFIEKAYT